MPPMSDMTLVIVFLGILSVCAIVLTVTMLLTTAELRCTLRQMRRSLGQLQRLLTRAGRTATRVDAVVHQACEAASGVLERFARLKERVTEVFHGHAGNGSGAGPRRRHGE